MLFRSDSQDIAEVEHVLRIYEKYKGLDRGDKSECIKAINEARKELAKDGNPYLTEERVQDVEKIRVIGNTRVFPNLL